MALSDWTTMPDTSSSPPNHFTNIILPLLNMIQQAGEGATKAMNPNATSTTSPVGIIKGAEDYATQERLKQLQEQAQGGKLEGDIAAQGRNKEMYDMLSKLSMEDPEFVRKAAEIGVQKGDNPEKYTPGLMESQQRSADRESQRKLTEAENEKNRIAREQSLQEKLKEEADKEQQRLADKKEARTYWGDLKKELAEMGAKNKEFTFSHKKDQWTEDQWQKFAKATNPLSGSSRSAVGQSGIANVRAARAMDLITDPSIVTDPKMFDQVQTDIDGIMKGGGAPTDIQYKDHYNTLKNDLAKVWGFVASKPESIAQPEIKDQLINVLNGLRSIDNKVIEKNLGVGKVSFEGIINDNPARAERFFTALAGTQDVFPDENRKNLPGGSSSLPKPQTTADFDKLTKGDHYIDPDDGKEYIK
jgi:hypothetical protein